jgi:hypothetical protein
MLLYIDALIPESKPVVTRSWQNNMTDSQCTKAGFRVTTARRKKELHLSHDQLTDLGGGLEVRPTLRLTSVDKLDLTTERRNSQRLRARCYVELTTNLSILDSEAEAHTEQLVFFGETRDLSSQGIGFVLPSTRIDENYCSGENRFKLSLHLPEGPVKLEVNPVRCVPLNAEDFGQGYLLGTKIVGVLEHETDFERFLRTFPDVAPDR